MTRVLLEMSMLEAAHLTDLVDQFADLIAATVDDDAIDDEAVARLVPDAYRDDAAASDEFRRLTQGDLLDRRRDDAALVLSTLRRDGVRLRPGDVADPWYTDDFDAAWRDIESGCRALLAQLKK